MDKIITATGKQFDSDYFVPMQDPQMLFLRVLNQSKSAIGQVFSNPAETSCLTSGDRTALGYTNLISIFEEGEAFKVVLKK